MCVCIRGGGGGPVAGILAVAPYSGTDISVSTRTLATSVSVSGKVQKNLGDSTHPIGKTRSMHIIAPSSYGAYETTYVKTPT